jgi:hypothetical protein
MADEQAIPIFGFPIEGNAVYDWLRARPYRWRHVIAARAALRVLPTGLSAQRDRESSKVDLALFRATAIARFMPLCTEESIETQDYRLRPPGSASDAASATVERVVSKSSRAARQAAADAASTVSFYTASLSASGGVAAAVDAITNSIVGSGGSIPLIAAITADVRSLQEGTPHEQVLVRPLWNKAISTGTATTDWLDAKSRLLRLGPHWQVWTYWYDHVLDGLQWTYAWEEAYTDLAGHLPWDYPAVANGMLAKRLEALPLGPHPIEEDPRPIEGIASPIAVLVRADGRIGIDAGALATPTLPGAIAVEDHASVVLACRRNADSLRVLASAPSFQGRSDYANALAEHLEWLPDAPRKGNVLLADTAARILNKLFTAEQDILPLGFAVRLTTFLENHIALRAYYPELERHYQTVITGRLMRPLARDVVDSIQRTISDHTPAVFEDSVSAAINDVAKPIPEIRPLNTEDAPSRDPNRPRPPGDPVTDVDPIKLREFTFASTVSRIWSVLQKGKDLPTTIEGWQKAYEQMRPYVGAILNWLREFLSGGRVPPVPPT